MDVVSAPPDPARTDAAPVEPDVVELIDAASSESPATSRVEIVLHGPSANFSEASRTLVTMRAMFGVGPGASFDRAMAPAGMCVAQRVGPCELSRCGRSLGAPTVSSGTLTATNGSLRIASEPSREGRYSEVGPATHGPWMLESTTVVSATGSASVAPWAVELAVPGFAPITSAIPAVIHRAQPLALTFGAPHRASGQRAVMVSSNQEITLFCSFEPGAPTEIPPAALAAFSATARVRVTAAAVSEQIVQAGRERVLVSTIFTTTSIAESSVD